MNRSPLERFFKFFKFPEEVDGCWEWTGAMLTSGRDGSALYGSFHFEKKTWRAHRWSYRYLKGLELEFGMDIDHICCNSKCVNPAHLEQVTHEENVARGCERRQSERERLGLLESDIPF